ncbi:MAG TPA: hypothetical protein DHD79_01060 [Firmicutes bacterium]|nr:hypothetical protein [Bacillota bacterium]HAW70617.1 hypothetical protein [Bacillota bacterium]HAZ22896.1 hypothetical protein [Bacillota bacterium]HBE06097.1 hypothetical protein [Bacillota bacterium]HBG43185.1 hypothetical protein [Bacillota bacterium]
MIERIVFTDVYLVYKSYVLNLIAVPKWQYTMIQKTRRIKAARAFCAPELVGRSWSSKVRRSAVL